MHAVAVHYLSVLQIPLACRDAAARAVHNGGRAVAELPALPLFRRTDIDDRQRRRPIRTRTGLQIPWHLNFIPLPVFNFGIK